MGDLIKEFAKMASGWIGASYQRIHADLQKKPLVTLFTLLLLVCFVIGGSYLGLAIYGEFNKEDAQVIFERSDLDADGQSLKSPAPGASGQSRRR
jgi:hypothetical protein